MRTIWSPISAAASGSVYEADPTIDFISSPDDHSLALTVHRDEVPVSSICRMRSSVVMA
jgi:hypothetical protein